ncbi:MAG: hypothetical protein L3J74_18185 [Bacteroidales bacterium]|nr:hypothetical protein [Bacteroidales bacterium]
MKTILKNILVLILGLIIGSAVNMGLIMISSAVIPPPAGADVTTMEGLKASIHLFQPQHFIFPFLAHALGTFIGALFTGLLATNNKIKWSLAIGLFFLIGGIANAALLPAPTWFIVTDILGAYIPMAFMGWKLANKLTPKK